MRRLFVTTNFSQAVGMYNRDRYEDEKKYIEKEFKKLPKEYSMDDNFKVIVHIDSNLNWEQYNIDMSNDYILYHASSELNVKDKITKSFSHYRPGSHELDECHDIVFQAIMNNKSFDEILVEIFPSITITIQGKSVTIPKLEAEKAFKKLYKSGTLAAIKELNKENITNDIETIKEDIQILKNYFSNIDDITTKLNAIDSNKPMELIHFLNSNQQFLAENLLIQQY